MKKIINKQTILLLIFCCFLSFLMCFSPLAQGHGHGYDSAIYAAVANAMTKGRVLYSEIIDNKGMLMYFIDAVGLLINYKFGIFYLEFIFLLISTFFAYKTSLLITKDKKWLSCFVVISAMLLLVYTLDGGNFTEEYAIMFTNIATFFIVKFFINKYNIKWYELLIIGMCFAATFMLRANLCAFYVAEVLVIVFCLLKNKQYSLLLKSISFVALGAVVFCIPFVIYLLRNNSFNNCLSLVYFEVLDSFGEITLRNRFDKVVGLIEISNQSNVFTIATMAILTIIIKPKIDKNIRPVVFFSIIGLFINIYVNSLTGGPAWAYKHYYISFVPIMVVIISWFYNYMYEKINQLKFDSEFKRLITIILVFLILSKPCAQLSLMVVERYSIEEPQLGSIEKYIIDNSNDNDTIQIIGVNDALYYPVNRISTSKHLYFVAGFSEERRKQDANEIAEDLIKASQKAKILLFEKGNLDDLIFIQSLDKQEEFVNFINSNYIFDKENSELFGCNVYILKEQ